MNILVVGGAGYIGSHVVQALFQAGHHPITYDNLSTGHAWAVRYGSFVQADIEDEQTLLQTFEKFQPEAVIHLASLTNVRDSIKNPSLYYQNNLLGALSLLKMMVRANVKSLVFSSTAAIYGSPQYVPIDEKHPKAPLNAYGKTKWAIEGMLEDFSNAYGLRCGALRYFNACGADPSGAIGEAHEPETHLIPLAIQAALGKRPPLQIYGDQYPTPDGTAIRDYIHVLDLAAAHVLALSFLIEERKSFQVNLGTGSGFSVKQIIEAVSHHTLKEVPFEAAPPFPQDSPILVADPALAQRLLGWKPRYSDLSTIISTAWRWETQDPRSRLHELQQSKVYNV